MFGLPAWRTLSIHTAAYADTIASSKAWKFDGIIGLNATGTGLVNWAGGGKKTVSGLTFAKVLNVTLSTCLKYINGTLIADSNGVEKERVQFKAVVGIGLGYSF